MENVKEMINIKKEILNAVKNVKLEETKHFDAGNFYNATSVDLVISFDLKDRHIKFEKEFKFNCALGAECDEAFECDMLEKNGYSEEDIEQMPDEEREDFWEGLYSSEFNDWCKEQYLDDLLDYEFGEDDAALIELAHEYIEENIEEFYMVKDAGYACNFETYIDALYVFGEFVGYIKYDDLNINRNIQLLKKKYVKVGKILSETGDNVEYEMYWGGLDLAVRGDKKWICPKYLDEDVYDVKIEENGDIMMADFYSFDDVAAA